MKKGDDTEIVELKKAGKSFREIGRALQISHVATRKRYVRALKVNGGNLNSSESKMLTNANIADAPDRVLPNTTAPKSNALGPRYTKGQRYLRKIGEDYVWIYTPALMSRGDMEEVRWTGDQFVLVTKVGC